MSSEKTAIMFWDLVARCLVDFHDLGYDDAHKKSMELRGRLVKSDRPDDGVLPGDIVYHAEPFDIACSLMGEDLSIEEHRDRYTAILKEHGL